MQGWEQHQHGPYLVCKPIAGQQEHANAASDRCTLTHNTAERSVVTLTALMDIRDRQQDCGTARACNHCR